MIPDPNSDTPLPRLDYTITSRNPDLRDHTIIAETAHQVLHPYSQVNSLGRKILEKTYPEYPEVPRLLVLTPEEAGEVGVPGFKVNTSGWFGTGVEVEFDVRHAETDVHEEQSKWKRMEGGAGEGWWGSGWIGGWRSKSTSLSASNSKSKPVKGGWQEAGVTVLPGTTVRITTTALRILVPDPQRRRDGLKDAS
jgi:hypothetical protein